LEERVITKFRPECRTEYREVQRVVYRKVPETHEKEIVEEVRVPGWREEVRQRTLMVPVTTERLEKRTVLKTEWQQEQRQRVVPVPAQKVVEHQVKVVVPEVRHEQRRETVLVPATRREHRERVVTKLRPVTELQTRPVPALAKVEVPVADPCLGIVGAVGKVVPAVRPARVPVTRLVAEKQVEHFDVNVPALRPVSRAVTVAVPSSHEELRTVRSVVPTVRPVVEKYTVPVPITRKEVETVRVPVTEMRPKVETYTVRVPEVRIEKRVRRVPVTTYRTVAETITERVPVKTVVQVPYQVRACVPVDAVRKCRSRFGSSK